MYKFTSIYMLLFLVLSTNECMNLLIKGKRNFGGDSIEREVLM